MASDLMTASQDAIFAALDAGVPAELGTVVQHVPEDWQPPLIVIGSIEANSEEESDDEDPLERHTIEILYTYRGEARRGLYAIMHAGRHAIVGATLAAAGAVFGKARWKSSADDLLEDGVTYTGIQFFEILVQPDDD